MTDINHLECTEVADVVYSISDSDVNADGIAEKTVDIRCVNNLEIYNAGYGGVILHLLPDVEVRGRVTLESAGSLVMDFAGSFKFLNIKTENVNYLKLDQSQSDVNARGVLSGLSVPKLNIAGQNIFFEGESTIGVLNVDAKAMFFGASSELVSHNVLIKSANAADGINGKVMVEDSFIYQGVCIKNNVGSSITSKSGNINILLSSCDFFHSGYIWSGADVALEVKVGNFASQAAFGGEKKVSIKASGKCLIEKQLSSNEDLSVECGEVANNSTLLSKSSLSIKGNSISNTGAITADKITLHGKLHNSGKVQATGNLSIDAGNGDIVNEQSGVMFGQIALALLGQSIDNAGNISSEGSLDIGALKLVNKGLLYYKDGKIIVKNAILNYGKWVGASSTNIQMQKAGEIHNNKNAHIKLDGKSVIGAENNGRIALLRNYAGNIKISGTTAEIRAGTIENLAREGKIYNQNIPCNSGGRYSCSQTQQTVEHLNAGHININCERIELSVNSIKNQNSLLQIEGSTIFSAKSSIDNQALKLWKHGSYKSNGYWHRAWPNPKKCSGVGGEQGNRDARIFGLGNLYWSYYDCSSSASASAIYKSYPSTVAFTDVKGAQLAGLSNYAVAKSDLPGLIGQFTENSNALVPYDSRSRNFVA
jgi:adhesin HecA-like repeat protein